MTITQNFGRDTRIHSEAFDWACRQSWTHALTLTYPFTRPRRGELKRVGCDIAEGITILPGVTSFSNCSSPRWTSSSERSIQPNLRKLHAFVDKALCGCRFHKKPLGERSRFFAFPAGTNIGHMLHVHMVWKIPEDRISTFEAVFANDAECTPWNKLIPAGTHEMAPIYNIEGWINYSVKQSSWRSLVLSEQLVPEKI